MSEPIELKVGDKLIADSLYYGLSIVAVERLTVTQIVLSNRSKLKRPFNGDDNAIGDRGYATVRYRAYTPELYDQYLIQNLSRKISKVDFSKLPLSKLREIKAILEL